MNNDLISRSALLAVPNVCKVTEYDESGCGISYLAVSVDDIEAAPAVDAVEVVRCVNCKFSIPAYINPKAFKRCVLFCRAVTADFFCAHGEKMDAEVHDDA